jgi:hypothetical protein
MNAIRTSYPVLLFVWLAVATVAAFVAIARAVFEAQLSF